MNGDSTDSNPPPNGPGTQTPVAAIIKTAAAPLVAPGNNDIKRASGFAVAADYAVRAADDAWHGDTTKAIKDGATATAIAAGSSKAAMAGATDVLARTKAGSLVMKGVTLAEDAFPRFPVVGTAVSVAGAGVKAAELHAAGQDLKAEGTLVVKACEIAGAIGGGLAGGVISSPTVAGVPVGVAAGGVAGEEALGTVCARGWNYFHDGRQPVSDTPMAGVAEDAFHAAQAVVTASQIVATDHPSGTPSAPLDTPPLPSVPGSMISFPGM